MDREEVTKWLTIMKVNLRAFPEISNSKKMQALGEAIKIIEQEPVIDKLRAEIENMQIVYDKSANYKDRRTDEEKANDLGKMYKVLVLSIIDKYKAESEDT